MGLISFLFPWFRQGRPIRLNRVLITGASSGIGRALALAFAEQETKLILNARREDLLRELAAEIGKLGSQAAICAGDISEPATRDNLLAAARESFGGLDILINNAGIGAQGRFADADEERLRKIMEVNFFAATELTRHAIPMLRQGVQGVIVNIASILGRRGIPFHSEYCASKFALAGWSEALRAEVAPLGLNVLLVNPGTTETEFKNKLIARQGEMPWVELKGVSAETVAKETLRAIRRRKREIIPSRAGRWLLRANRWIPRLVDDWLARRG